MDVTPPYGSVRISAGVKLAVLLIVTCVLGALAAASACALLVTAAVRTASG